MTGEQEQKREAAGKEKETAREKKRVGFAQTEAWKIHDQAEVLLAAVTKEPGMSLWHLAWQHVQRISHAHLTAPFANLLSEATEI